MIINFQERMEIGRNSRKRTIERTGSSSVRIFATSAEMYGDMTEQEWIAPVVTSSTIDRAAIMRRAHQIARSCRTRFSSYRAALQYGLKASWEESRGILDFAA